ncbi:hypothetical protein Poli38472_008721 [Pythium oligandrum]|uniref:Uncharacterized protein n=1 Tax=Pythium oligandrum TaxID=41045 RepID=A0A8K1C437_PYTOL|nr:hypothetical protein Poli38472_008721 [Pythium oligandrum]|eukprot:TMW56073.1 hypothetical protein Poli38472_008721 [Pythium oligandrum]
MAGGRGGWREHLVLIVFLVVSSIVAAIVYELTSGGTVRQRVIEDPRLNSIDMQGDKPRVLWKEGEFECLGWKATHSCDPYGLRDPVRDRACHEPLLYGSGYCEVRNQTSGETMRLMLSTCKTWQYWLIKKVPVTCNDARHFTDFSINAVTYKHPPPQDQPPSDALDVKTSYKRGIGMIGYPKVIAGLYAIIRLLRFHGCTLPVEVWIDPSEMEETHSVLKELVRNYNVIVRTVQDPSASKFFAKPYAIYHSYFESVLFLDSDNIPVQDPTYLFDSPEFTTYGAMFWPDFWRPTVNTPFNVQEQSAMWQLMDMPFIDMYEQESGQLLVNRSRSAAALNMLMFYSSHFPRLLTDWHMVYGDKDLFRLAWVNTSTPFYYVPHLVALGGPYDESQNFFCGISMVQRDPNGDLIFMHRNQAKLTGRRDQKVLITHLQKFTGGNGDSTSLKRDLDKYRIQCKMGRLGQSTCFLLDPITPDGSDTPMLIQSLVSTKYPVLEKQAIHFSIEGRNLLTAAEEAEIAALEAKEDAKFEAEAQARLKSRRRSDRNFYLIVSAIVSSVILSSLCLWSRSRSPAAVRAGSTTRSPSFSSVSASSSSSSHHSIGMEGSFRRKKSFALRDDDHLL